MRQTVVAARRAAIAAAAPKTAKSPFQSSFLSIARNRTKEAGPETWARV
jgi:hypothetical protein